MPIWPCKIGIILMKKNIKESEVVRFGNDLVPPSVFIANYLTPSVHLYVTLI